MENVLGIDIGGSGIKGAPVDTMTGRLSAERHRIPTPQPATPKAVAEVVGEIAAFFDWKGSGGDAVRDRRVGATFPAVVKNGVASTAANVDKSWIGTDAARLFRRTSIPWRRIFLSVNADSDGGSSPRIRPAASSSVTRTSSAAMLR